MKKMIIGLIALLMISGSSFAFMPQGAGIADNQIIHYEAGAIADTWFQHIGLNKNESLLAVFGCAVLKEVIDGATGGKSDLNEAGSAVLGALTISFVW